MTARLPPRPVARVEEILPYGAQLLRITLACGHSVVRINALPRPTELECTECWLQLCRDREAALEIEAAAATPLTPVPNDREAALHLLLECAEIELRPVLFERTLADARTIRVLPLLNGYAQLTISRPLWPVHDDAWQYQSQLTAVIAAHEWDPAAEPEPAGWYRHVATGRRRPNGDPNREFVRE